MSIVFKLTSLEDLKNLAEALTQTATLQAKIQLEANIKRLAEEKRELEIEVEALRMQKRGLRPPAELEKEGVEEIAGGDLLELIMKEEHPTTLGGEGLALIEEITEEPAQVESERNDETPDVPEVPS